MSNEIGEKFTGLAIVGIFIGWSIGDLYWLWLSFQMESFWMFFLGFNPITGIFTGPIGFYALIAGTPDWIKSMFG